MPKLSQKIEDLYSDQKIKETEMAMPLSPTHTPHSDTDTQRHTDTLVLSGL